MVAPHPPTRAPNGPALLSQLEREMPALSPKLGNVARFCIEHAATLHHHRIQDVATACGTIPASVVRLAQRLGLSGFQELKLAFIEPGAKPATVLPLPASPSDAARAAVPGAGHDRSCQVALQEIDATAHGLEALRALVLRPAFLQAVQALRSARRISVDWDSDEDRGIATHLQLRLLELDPQRAQVLHRLARADEASDSAWRVNVAVWQDAAPGAHPPRCDRFGPRVLNLVCGRLDAPLPQTPGVIVMPVGTGARRMLNALALCEALALAIRSDPMP
jgi:Helix-turn-helix domain, rpiR family